MLQKLFQAIALTCLISLGIAVPAHAVILDEGDAGDSLNTYGATNTRPSGTSLTGIEGFLDGGDIDLYQIRLPGGSFTASTVDGTGLPTQLFLFDANGYGVTANNDDPSFPLTLQSTISHSNAGIYYLGISAEGYSPQSSAGPIFTVDDFNAVIDPATPGTGSGSPLSGWSTGFPGGREPYTINTTGAQFIGPTTAVPFEFSPSYGLAILGMCAGCDYLRKRGWQYLKKARG